MGNSSTSESTSTILVPMGDLDYFTVRRFVDAAAPHVVGAHPHDSVTVDLSAVPFCDSSVGAIMDWVDGLPDGVQVTVVTGPAVDRVLGLFPGAWAHRPRQRIAN